MTVNTVTLYRPVNDAELKLIKALNFSAFPPRLPEQPFFYPVLNEAYATEITVKWNVPAYGIGYVTMFKIEKNFADRYDIQNVGGSMHNELWVPTEELELFNSKIIGKIEVIATYT